MLIYAITKGSLARGVAYFCAGLILGSIGSMIYAANAIDQTLIQVETLISELSERDSRIERLEASLQETRERVVRSISVRLDVRDQHLNLRLTEIARSLIADLVGTELDTIDPIMVATIFNDRIVHVEQNTYTFRLELLVISDTLTVYLGVTPGPVEYSE